MTRLLAISPGRITKCHTDSVFVSSNRSNPLGGSDGDTDVPDDVDQEQGLSPVCVRPITPNPDSPQPRY